MLQPVRACEADVKSGASIYLSFIEVSSNRPGRRLPELSPYEERLFNHLAMAQYQGEHLSVREVMALRQLEAPATNHNRLKSLRAKGWLMLTDTEDSRRKHVRLTTAAWRQLERMSRCVFKAIATERELTKG